MREGWKEVKLGDILEIKHGYGFKGEFFKEDETGNVLVTPGNFNIGGGFKNEKLKYYDGPISEDFILKPNDVIVTMTDLSKMADTIGYSAKVPSSSKIYLHNQRIGLIKLLSNDVDIDFIYWFLRTSNYQRYVAGSSTGATVKHTSPTKIYSYKGIIPPLETQKKIASILSGYDDLIENNLKRIKILEEMAQQTYEEWFVRMRFPGYESATINKETGLPEGDVLSLPKGWEKVKLGDLCDLQQGFALNKKSQHYISDNKTEFPLLKISDLINNSETLFVKETIPNQFKIDFEDIIYSRTGQVGLSFIGVKGIIYNNCFKVKPFNEDIKYYLLQFLRQPITIDIAKSLATGAAQPDLNHSAFKSIEIKRADLNLCVRYSEYYKQIIRVIQNLQNQNQRLREARDILLPRLMMGMIEV